MQYRIPQWLLLASLVLLAGACGGNESSSSPTDDLVSSDGGDTDADVEPTDTGDGDSIEPTEDDTSTTEQGPDGSRVPPPTSAPIAQRCTYACDLMEDCGYLDLGAGFGGPGGFDCMQLCVGLPQFGGFIGVDGEEIQRCLTTATSCEGVRDCDEFGFIPELDQDCVRACRDLDAKLEECGPPIQLERHRAADGIHELEPTDLSHAFRFTPEAYREVLEVSELFPDTFQVWETPSRYILTFDGYLYGGLLDALRSHEGLLAEYPTYFTSTNLRVVVTDRAVVHFSELPEEGVEKTLGTFDLEIVEPLRIGGHGWVVRNTGDSDGFLRRLLDLGEVKGVNFAEPDFLRSYVAHDIQDPLFQQ